ncbi:MAG TPA: Nif3-like dinuclear metal center hexameric protein [Longimicrobiales bacterium]|nr:Nif3-like dinuclear metal center hexameric protein [Longimicrobiales bacterium]
MKLESLLQYLDGYLQISSHPDYPGALNGLQIEGGREEISHVVAAVDASEAAILEAIEAGADLLMVHHGLFWGGQKPLTGRLMRRVRPLIEAGVSLWSCHLPLDGHAEVGNSALLAKALGVKLEGSFAAYEGAEVGWHGRLEEAASAEELRARAVDVLGGPVRVLEGGPDRIERVGVVTGGGASFVEEAVELGLDAFVTGEGSHHTYFDAMELGVHVFLGGHYATETYGVKALAQHVSKRFDLTCDFLDLPTGL